MADFTRAGSRLRSAAAAVLLAGCVALAWAAEPISVV